MGITKSSNCLYMGKVFTEYTKKKEDAILRVRNDGIRKNGMCVPAAFTDDSCDTDILIDRFSMDDVNDGPLIGSMSFAVTGRMAAWTCLKIRTE